MNRSPVILAPTALATQLSAITGRPIVLKASDSLSIDGRVIDPEASRRRSLARAVEAFNAG